MRHRVATALIGTLLALAATQATAQGRPYPPDIDAARVETYKTVGDVALKLWIFTPEGHLAADRRAAIVFFFGGGWRGGNPVQFVPYAKYLASRGMLAAVADYRVSNRHGVQAKDCVADAKSAMRWLRAHAPDLGIDPGRIAAGGGSSGGHLAAATAILPGQDDPDDDSGVSPSPDALALFNPVVMLTSASGEPEPPPEYFSEYDEARLGDKAESLSPYHQVRSGLPPTLVLHGQADTTVPYKTVELFTERMNEAGNRCELVGYEDAGHGFFNPGRGEGGEHENTLRRLDAFLVSLGWLPPTGPSGG
jgi:acetyl esterase